MSRQKCLLAVTLCVLWALGLTGCRSRTGASSRQSSAPAPWQLEKMTPIGDFKAPQSVAVDAQRDLAFVSNIQAGPGGYWRKDANGFISLMEGNGMLKNLCWKESTPNHPLHAPKGMCVSNGQLYVADIDHVVAYEIKGEGVKSIEIPGAKKLKDLVAHAGAVYVSDSATGNIWKLGQPPARIKGPPSAEGLAFGPDGRMYCVSYDRHEIYLVDPTGADEPKPLGLASHFAGLDGIEVFADGTIIVSDRKLGRVFSVSASRKNVHILAGVKGAADLGLDRKRKLLYVPMISGGAVAIFRIAHR